MKRTAIFDMRIKAGRAAEKIKVFILVHLTWRLSKKRLLQSLRMFSATEDDSAWQIHHALQMCSIPDQRADLFAQILEERHHAEEFARLYKNHSGQSLRKIKEPRQALYEHREDLWKFFAYCSIGEQAAFERFSNIAAALPDSDVRRVLRKILRDEAGHVHGAEELIRESNRDAEEIRTELRQIRRRRFREAWLRAGTKVTDLAATIFLMAIYLIVGPLGAVSARRRLFTVSARRRLFTVSARRRLFTVSVRRRPASGATTRLSTSLHKPMEEQTL